MLVLDRRMCNLGGSKTGQVIASCVDRINA